MGGGVRKSYYLGIDENESTSEDPIPGSVAAMEMDIRLLAYDMWMADGYPPGDDTKHWLEAESWWYREWKKFESSQPCD